MLSSRRPSVTIYDYPEHLNPFNDDIANSHSQIHRDAKSSAAKEGKHKFWTFGRSRKKRSNSFSIKSTWNGLFGKRKESADSQEKKSAITTVSSTYKRQPFDKPVAPPRISRDQQEFDEALGTLARRRKYTLDNTSRYSSSLTVNGDLSRIYDGSPQDTMASIMGDLTPKPPVRRFGQVSPRPTDKIPAFDYDDKEHKENGTVTLRDKGFERMPVPPIRRSGTRLSHRLNNSTLDSEDEMSSKSGDITLRDENENVPEDYIFKRFNQDAVRKSNLSINSCVSIGSTVSAYGRKKRRAPQPPRCKEQLETSQENDIHYTTDIPRVKLQITESIDIVRVTENIDEMTKKSNELIDISNKETDVESASEVDDKDVNGEVNGENMEYKKTTALPSTSENVDRLDDNVKSVEKESTKVVEEQVHATIECNLCLDVATEKESTETMDKQEVPEKLTNQSEKQIEFPDLTKEDAINFEYCRSSSKDKLEIFKEVGKIDSLDEVCLRGKGSSGNLSRRDSFSVKDEIEKIEKQIKALESKNTSTESTYEKETEDDPTSNMRLSIQANRRHFFQNMVDADKSKDRIKIEYKELPREQNIHVIKLTDPPVPVSASTEPVKVIELHISEPIKQKPELLDEINPIPKPRRHSALNFNGSEPCAAPRGEHRTSELLIKKGKSF